MMSPTPALPYARLGFRTQILVLQGGVLGWWGWKVNCSCHREGERERKRERGREGEREGEREGDCERERGRERESVCVCVSVCKEVPAK